MGSVRSGGPCDWMVFDRSTGAGSRVVDAVVLWKNDELYRAAVLRRTHPNPVVGVARFVWAMIRIAGIFARVFLVIKPALAMAKMLPRPAGEFIVRLVFRQRMPDREWLETSTGSGKTKRLVEMNQRRRVLRIRGREYSLPASGETLVLLVHGPASGPVDATVVLRSVVLIPPEAPETPPSATHEARHAWARERRSRMMAALQSAFDANEDIAAFLRPT